jgi:hypothetical protein
MFEAFYASGWQHPVALWVAAAVGLVAALAHPRVHRSAKAFACGLAGLAMVDAWLTTSVVPGIGALSPPTPTIVAVFFVLSGDFRYFALREWVRADGTIRPSLGGAWVAIGFTLLIPIFSQVVVSVLAAEEPRVLFFVHEFSFVVFVLLRRVFESRSNTRPSDWGRRLDWIVLAWYGAWATADLIILSTGSDLGFLLRVLPNLLYYGAFPPFLVWSSPAEGAD